VCLSPLLPYFYATGGFPPSKWKCGWGLRYSKHFWGHGKLCHLRRSLRRLASPRGPQGPHLTPNPHHYHRKMAPQRSKWTCWVRTEVTQRVQTGEAETPQSDPLPSTSDPQARLVTTCEIKVPETRTWGFGYVSYAHSSTLR
jgi:hypothetical protein